MGRENNKTPFFLKGQSSFGRMLITTENYRLLMIDRLFDHPKGGVDFAFAAKSGVRIFLFVTEDYLESHPKAKRYITGTWKCLDGLIKSGKIESRETDNGLHNPLQNVWDEEMNRESNPHLAISDVTAGEFHRAFGADAFTQRFARLKEKV